MNEGMMATTDYLVFVSWAQKQGWLRLSPLMEDSYRQETWLIPNGEHVTVKVFANGGVYA